MSVFDSLKDFPFEDDYEQLTDWCSGKRNRFYGLKHSDETKQYLSEVIKDQYANGRVPHNKGKYKPDDEITYSGLYARDYKRGIKKIDKNRKFITPEGETITITDVKAYCKEHNLTYQTMLRVYRGEYKQHKGYRKG
jgi:hypothetical protein